VTDPLKGIGETANALQHLVNADPVKFPVCETVVIHDGRGFRWNRQVALHRLEDGRLEQVLIRGRGPAAVPVLTILIVLAVVVTLGLYLLGVVRISIG
jgi:hypothetical protein